MSESSNPLGLPGLQKQCASIGPGAPAPVPAPPRVKPVERNQCVWRSVDVEELIEQEHPARAIWALSAQLDLSRFYAPIEAVQGAAGRTAWDPRLLVSLWIYAYSRGISSARELARRCQYEPAFEWLCGLESINHHTLSDFRVEHGKALQELFVQMLGVLSAQSLVSLERVMHDGTKVQALASRDSFKREATLQEHLTAARQQLEVLTAEASEQPSRQQAAQQRAARERQQRVEQALEQLEQLRQTKSSEQEKQEARASLSDAQARNMKQSNGGYTPSYNVQLSTEASHKIIVGVGVSQNGNDYGELVAGIQRVEQNLQAKPAQVVTDGGFTSRENILAIAAQGIDFIGSLPEPATPKPAGQTMPEGTTSFTMQAFSYDVAQDQYTCPAGQTLRCVREDKRRAGVVHYSYRAQKTHCQACPLKEQCCPQSTEGRSVLRSVEEAPVQAFRQKMQSAPAKEIYRQRAPVAEFPNAWLKAKLGLRQFRLRGLAKVHLEALWACLTYNIQQWIRLCWLPGLTGAQPSNQRTARKTLP